MQPDDKAHRIIHISSVHLNAPQLPIFSFDAIPHAITDKRRFV